MQTLTIANQKGGTGKTTTALNLGYGLAALGGRVLLLDLDPQASLTLATVGDCAGASLAEVLGDAKPGRVPIPAVIRNLAQGLDLAPGDLSLSNTELGLTVRPMRETVLRRALANLSGYDLALIDCGPSLGLLVINALVAADGVLCPTQPTALDLRGLRLFLGSLEAMRAEELTRAELLGVLVCQYDNRLLLHRAALEDLRGGHIPLLPVVITKSVKAQTTAGEGDPLTRGPLAEQYQQLSEYINSWLTNKN